MNKYVDCMCKKVCNQAKSWYFTVQDGPLAKTSHYLLFVDLADSKEGLLIKPKKTSCKGAVVTWLLTNWLKCYLKWSKYSILKERIFFGRVNEVPDILNK